MSVLSGVWLYHRKRYNQSFMRHFKPISSHDCTFTFVCETNYCFLSFFCFFFLPWLCNKKQQQQLLLLKLTAKLLLTTLYFRWTHSAGTERASATQKTDRGSGAKRKGKQTKGEPDQVGSSGSSYSGKKFFQGGATHSRCGKRSPNHQIPVKPTWDCWSSYSATHYTEWTTGQDKTVHKR